MVQCTLEVGGQCFDSLSTPQNADFNLQEVIDQRLGLYGDSIKKYHHYLCAAYFEESRFSKKQDPPQLSFPPGPYHYYYDHVTTAGQGFAVVKGLIGEVAVKAAKILEQIEEVNGKLQQQVSPDNTTTSAMRELKDEWTRAVESFRNFEMTEQDQLEELCHGVLKKAEGMCLDHLGDSDRSTWLEYPSTVPFVRDPWA